MDQNPPFDFSTLILGKIPHDLIWIAKSTLGSDRCWLQTYIHGSF